MKIFKGRIFSFLRKPDDINDTGSYIYLEKGAVVCDDKGMIVEVNDYSKLNKKYKSAKTEDFGSKIICPGFIDLHNHFPQTQVIASYGTFSTGINIKNLHNIVFSSPSKSKIRVLQSIGRGLRLGSDKDNCKLFDLADDFTYKSKQNFTLRHFMERINIYNQEQFDYTIHRIKL